MLEPLLGGYGRRPRGARLASGGRDPRARRAPVPAPGAGLAGPRRSDARGRGGEPVTRALVTGCAGFIGSHLTEALLADGADVLGIDCFNDNYARRRQAREPRALPPVRPLPAGHRRPLRRRPRRAAGRPRRRLPPRRRARSAGELGARASTATCATTSPRRSGCSRPRPSCRGGGSSTPRPRRSTATPSGSRRPRTRTPQPLSPYGVTKLAAEQLCRLYHAEHGVDAVALRFFSVYGPRQRPDMAFRRFCGAAVARRADRAVRRRQPDARLHLRRRRRRRNPRRGGRARRRRARLQHRRRRAREPQRRARAARRDRRPAARRPPARPRGRRRPPHRGRIGRARAELGFAPATALEQGLAAEFEWVLARSSPGAELRERARV